MNTQQTLKPCPACGSEAKWVESTGGYVTCLSSECRMVGPFFDPTGAKWNALPRREGKDVTIQNLSITTPELPELDEVRHAMATEFALRLLDQFPGNINKPEETARVAVKQADALLHALAPSAAQPAEPVNTAHAIRAAIIAQCPTLHAVTVVFETMEHPTHCERVKDGWTVFVHLDGKCERFAAPTAAEVQAKAEAFLREEMAAAAQPEPDDYADVQGRWKSTAFRCNECHIEVDRRGKVVPHECDLRDGLPNVYDDLKTADAVRAAVARGDLKRCDEQGRIIEQPRPEDVEAAKIDAACERGREQEVQS